MSSSTSSSSSSGEKKLKVRRPRMFLGIRWSKETETSKSLSQVDGDMLPSAPGSSTDSSDSSSGFMTSGNVEWANPDWDLSQEFKPDMATIVPYPCQVTCSLTLVSRRPVRDLNSLLRKLELWVDQYNGSYVSRPYHTLIYILLGSKLVQRKATSRNHEYCSKFHGVIRFGIPSDRNKPPHEKFQLVMREGMDESYYAISFDCHLVESLRKGVLYSELYKMSGYHYTFPSMMELLGLNVTLNAEGLISPA